MAIAFFISLQLNKSVELGEEPPIRMDKITLSKISSSFPKVFEQEVFMASKPTNRLEFLDEGWPFILGWITFKGDISGNVLMAVPVELAKSLAGNFLGMPSDDIFVEQNYQASFKEILSITCEQMLNNIGEGLQVIKLDPPKVANLTSNDLNDLAHDPDCVSFDVEGFPVLFRMDFE